MLGLNDDVLRFHVAMDDAVMMQIHECVQCALRDPRHMFRVEPARFFDDLLQCLSFDVAHDERKATVVEMEYVAHRRDREVSKVPHRFRFLYQHVVELGLDGGAVLHADRKFRQRVFADVRSPEAAFGDEFPDDIGSDGDPRAVFQFLCESRTLPVV